MVTVLRQEFYSNQRCLGNLIGSEGRFKRFLEKKYNVQIRIRSSGTVTITSLEDMSVDLFQRFELFLYAIRLGFSGPRALTCLDPKLSSAIESFSLDPFRFRTRLRSRPPSIHLKVIGKAGRTKKLIEDKASVSLVITPKCIHILGELYQIELAREYIINKLLNIKIENTRLIPFESDEIKV